LSYWNTRGKRFKRMSLSRLCQSGTTAAGQIAGGAMGGGATGLVAGQVAGQLAACAVLATSTRTGPAPPQGHGASRSTPYLELLHRYRKFPLYSTWGTLMNAAAFQCVPVVLFSLFGSAVTGFYSLAFRLVGAPMALIGSALGNVLLQRVAAQLARERDVSSLVAKVIGRSILVFAPAFILLALVAPPVFPFLLGPEWGTSGRYVQIMALLFLMQLVVSPASVVLIALQKQHVVGAIQGLLLVGAVTSLVVSGRLSGNPNVSLGVYTASQSAIYLLYLYAIVRYSGTSVSAIARECSWRRGPSRGMRGEA
jgi:O-antigen/teichoic acid export membrane protein